MNSEFRTQKTMRNSQYSIGIRWLVQGATGIGFGLLGGGFLQPLAEAQKHFPDEACYKCHGVYMQEEGEEVPYVDKDLLSGSVHEKIPCIQCHESIQEIPHKDKVTTVDCTHCHHEGNEVGAPDFSPFDIYKDSVHGRALVQEGETDAATCIHCHGKHNIRPPSDPRSTINRQNIPRTCATCHEDMRVVEKHHIHAERPYQEYEQSVHGRALFKSGLVHLAAVCTDCHGVHNIQGASDFELSAHQPETCGKCHEGIYETYRESIHGKIAIEEKNPDAPVCVDCHGEHTILEPSDPTSTVSPEHIPETCSQCHASEFMRKYPVPVDRIVTYDKSFHGIAHSMGSVTVANCSSCHGFHDILPSTDPRSSIHVSNIPSTCGKCHPKASANFAKGKVHVDVSKPEAGALYYIRWIFIWTFIILLIISFIWVIPDIRRKRRERALKNG
jgi:hypothetical protein